MSRKTPLPAPNFRGRGGRRSKGGAAKPPRSGFSPGALLLGLLLGGGFVWIYDHVIGAPETIRPALHAARGGAISAPPAAPSAAVNAPATHMPAEPPLQPHPARPAAVSPARKAAVPAALTGSAATRPRVAIVMDDAGNGGSLQVVQSLARLDTRLTVAVIPYLHDSVAVADFWHEQGREVILHLPMEADDDAAHAAGEGALRTGMTDESVRDTVLRDVAAVPHVTGVNNHMGSRATADPRLMRLFLGALKPSGLYFLDSRTSGKSVAYATAQQLGIRSTMRNGTFLDDERTPASIHAALATLLQQARTQGGAVGIGHVTSPETVAVLTRELPGLARDYDFVYASELAH